MSNPIVKSQRFPFGSTDVKEEVFSDTFVRFHAVEHDEGSAITVIEINKPSCGSPFWDCIFGYIN
ncbi:hypothetical protein, partial [Photobacterium sanguinicancri]